MSFNLNEIGSYGTNENEDVEISSGVVENLNSYARVTKIDELDNFKIHIDLENAYIADISAFTAGKEILLHVSAAATETAHLGKYLVAKILLSQYGVLTLDKDATQIIPRDQFDFYNVQAVNFATFDCLTIKSGGSIMPQPFDPYKFHGGIVALKVFNILKFEGGNINLIDCGIPANRKHLLRPLTHQETAAVGESDNAELSGQENSLTAKTFLLNAGDGAAFIVAKSIICNPDSRIGNPETHGAHFCRGAENSIGVKPSNITNKGGSTILICAESIKDFDAKMLAKYRSSNLFEGAGLCRCYIASKTVLPNDEGLYSYDRISDVHALTNELNVKDFGNGSYGDVINPKKSLNCYAKVIAISQGGCRLKISDEVTSALTPIVEGGLVLVQMIHKSKAHVDAAGLIVLAKVLSRNDNSNTITIDFPIPTVDLENYSMQVISVPQFRNLTFSGEDFTATRKFDGIGGVFAVAVNGVLKLSNAKIDVTDKGGAAQIEEIGNAQSYNRLLMGSRHGSIFILANEIELDVNSRIGADFNRNVKGYAAWYETQKVCDNAHFMVIANKITRPDDRFLCGGGFCYVR